MYGYGITIKSRAKERYVVLRYIRHYTLDSPHDHRKQNHKQHQKKKLKTKKNQKKKTFKMK